MTVPLMQTADFNVHPGGRTLGENKIDVIVAYIHALEKTSSQNTDIHE